MPDKTPLTPEELAAENARLQKEVSDAAEREKDYQAQIADQQAALQEVPEATNPRFTKDKKQYEVMHDVIHQGTTHTREEIAKDKELRELLIEKSSTAVQPVTKAKEE